METFQSQKEEKDMSKRKAISNMQKLERPFNALLFNE